VYGGGRGGSGGQHASAGGPRDSRNPGRPAGRVAGENRHHLTSAEYRVLGDLEAAIERTRSELYVPAGGRGRRPPGDAPQDGLRDALEILENSRGLVGVGAKAIRLLADAYPEVKAYLAPPRTLGEMRRTEEFKSFNSFDSYKSDMGPAKPGHELHHCVAQSSGFAPNLIHTTQNILEIPYWRHIRISAYYNTKQAALGNLSPREWLKGRNFDEHEEFCWKTLRQFGALP
jgi:hypothetical protein